MSEPVYHITTRSEWRDGISQDFYRPRRFEADGFIHCATGRERVLAVARDYFQDTSDEVVVLQIDPVRLNAPLIFEAAAPIDGGGREHLQEEILWPHLYGPLNLDAVLAIGRLDRVGSDFLWPETMSPPLSST